MTSEDAANGLHEISMVPCSGTCWSEATRPRVLARVDAESAKFSGCTETMRRSPPAPHAPPSAPHPCAAAADPARADGAVGRMIAFAARRRHRHRAHDVAKTKACRRPSSAPTDHQLNGRSSFPSYNLANTVRARSACRYWPAHRDRCAGSAALIRRTGAYPSQAHHRVDRRCGGSASKGLPSPRRAARRRRPP